MVWVWSGFHALPFAGGLAQQPAWLVADFMTFLREYHWQQWNATLPDTSGLPRLDEV